VVTREPAPGIEPGKVRYEGTLRPTRAGKGGKWRARSPHPKVRTG